MRQLYHFHETAWKGQLPCCKFFKANFILIESGPRTQAGKIEIGGMLENGSKQNVQSTILASFTLLDLHLVDPVEASSILLVAVIVALASLGVFPQSVCAAILANLLVLTGGDIAFNPVVST